MIFLEVVMIAIGLGAVILSLRMPSDAKEEQAPDAGADLSGERDTMRLQSLLDSFTTKAETVCDNLEEKMSRLSNEKIMGMNEYSDQVLQQIEKNHEDVVFLYDMMNEKQEEIKALVHDVDVRRAELRNDAAEEYQKLKEQGKLLDEMKKELEVEILQLDRMKGEDSHQEAEIPDFSLEEELEEEPQPEDDFALPDTDDVVLPDEEFDASYEIPADVWKMPAGPDEFYELEVGNHNDEILSLYKKGRSVLEISKMLSLGQGEVKFVIDMYNAG